MSHHMSQISYPGFPQVSHEQDGNHLMDLRRSCEHGYNTDCQKSRRSDWPLTYLTFMLTTDVHGPCPKITSYPRNPSNLHSVNVGLFSREGVLLFRVSSKMKIRLASEPVLCSLPLSSDFHFATLSAQQNFFPDPYMSTGWGWDIFCFHDCNVSPCTNG